MAPLDSLYASQSRLLRESVWFIGSVMALLLISVNDYSFSDLIMVTDEERK